MTPEQKAVLREAAERLQERVDELLEAATKGDASTYSWVLDAMQNQIEQAQIDLEVAP